MTIDWVSIGIAVASALVTALVHKTATQSTNPTAPAQPATSTGGLFHGGLLNRLTHGGGSGGSVTGHPVLDSVVSMLQSVVTQNPQLLTSLSGVLVQLQHPSGSVNLNLSNSGGTTNATQTPSTPAAAVPIATGS